jgi:hypothetical protein
MEDSSRSQGKTLESPLGSKQPVKVIVYQKIFLSLDLYVVHCKSVDLP